MKRGIGLLVGVGIIVTSLFWGTDGLPQEWIWELRVPRVLAALASGVALSVGGVLLQALYANPLADPYLLGVSSGAALGAVVTGSAFGAWIGSAGFGIPLLLLSWKRAIGNQHMLLVGVMLGFLASGALALWFSIASPDGVAAGMAWLLGSFTRVTLSEAWVGSVLVMAVVLFLLLSRPLSRDLDSLLLGEFDAATLGVDVHSVRIRVLGITSVLVAISVVLSGSIGFVGLVVPHWARAMGGPLHAGGANGSVTSGLIVRSAMLGGLSLVVADFFARTLWAPRELPVGAICTLVGGPLFIWILLGGGKRRART